MRISTAIDFDYPAPAAPVSSTAPGPDESRLLATLTLAFANDPAARWLYPAAGEYLRQFPSFVVAFGGGAVALGTAYHAEDHAACALWLPPGEEPDEAGIVDVVERSIPKQRHEEVFAVFEAMGRVHPSQPHWYLPLIGVDTSAQGRGLGSALLRHTLAACDRDGFPAYLEATTPRNVSLYERHGFQRLGLLRVGTCPPITPMWRPPRR